MMTNCSPPLWKTELTESKNGSKKATRLKKEGRKKKGNSGDLYNM